MEKKKVSNLFVHHRMLVQDANILKKIIVIFFEFFSKLCVNPYENFEFYV